MQYAQGKLAPHKSQPEILLTDLDRIFLIGGSDLLKRFQNARQGVLKNYLVKSRMPGFGL